MNCEVAPLSSLELPPHPRRRFLRLGIDLNGFFVEKSAEVKEIKKKEGGGLIVLKLEQGSSREALAKGGFLEGDWQVKKGGNGGKKRGGGVVPRYLMLG